ncbi:hypothetical protein LTR83_006493 [Exophiala xenobiotica]|nr:hypothetical protein LTR83_006493 [Exophiala xenobiotica]
MSSPSGSPTEAGSESRDTNLPTTTSPRLDGVFSNSSENDGNNTSSATDDHSSDLPTTTSPRLDGDFSNSSENNRSNTSSTIDDHSNDLPTTTSPLVNGATSDTSQNNHIESSSTIDDDSINLLATTTPIPNGSSSDTSADTSATDRSETSDTIGEDSINLLATTTPIPNGSSSDTSSDTSVTDRSETSDTIGDDSINLLATTTPLPNGSSSDTSSDTSATDRIETSDTIGNDSIDLLATTTPLPIGSSSDTSEDDCIDTSDTIDDDSENLPTTTSSRRNGVSTETSNDRLERSSSLGADSIDLLATTTPLPDDTSSDTTDPDNTSSTSSEVHDETVIVSSVKITDEQRLDLQGLATAASLLRELDFPDIDAAATLPATAWNEQPWSFANLRFVVPRRQPSTQFPLQPRHLANGFHDEDHAATPTTPTPRQGSLAQMRIPQQTPDDDMDGYMPRDNLQAQALRIYENAAGLRRAATASNNNNNNNNLRDVDVAFPHVNGLVPDTPAPAAASPPGSPRRYHSNDFPITPARPGSPEASASPQRRLRRVGRSPSLRSLSLSAEPILPSPDRQRPGTPSPPASEAGMDRDARAEAYIARLYAAAAEAQGVAVARPEPEPQQVDDWRAPDDYMSDEEDENEDEDDREGGAPLNLDEFPEGVIVAGLLRAGFEALGTAREEVNALDGGDNGNLPAGMRGVPAAVRARMELLLAEENFTGATRQLMERLAFEREVAGAARQGYERYEEEARRLAGFLGEARLDADAWRAEARFYADLVFELHGELARARLG